MEKNSEKIFLTKEGLGKLKTEYNGLLNVKRKEMAEKIQAARAEGDITDNAMYETARQEQAFVEGRIEELEEMLKRVAVVEASTPNGEVMVGSKVKVHIEGSDDEFHLVSAPEADPLSKKISVDSPLGQAMLGKKAGDEVIYEAPVGKVTYQILEVK